MELQRRHGSVAQDVSGNNNLATLTNPTLWGPGEYGGGINLGGAGFLSVPDSPSLDIAGNALTLSMWINPQPGTVGDSVIIGKFWNATMTSPFYQYGIELDGGTTPRFFAGTGGSASMGSALPFNQWTHLAVVFTGSQAQFYRDAVLVAAPPLTTTLTARAQRVHIGADANNSRSSMARWMTCGLQSRSLPGGDRDPHEHPARWRGRIRPHATDRNHDVSARRRPSEPTSSPSRQTRPTTWPSPGFGSLSMGSRSEPRTPSRLTG